MTKVMLVKTARGLRGATADDQAAYAKFKRRLLQLKPGAWLRMEWSTPRNGAQHRKMFALLALVAENSETYNSTEKALVAVKLAGGWVDAHIDPRSGEVLNIPRSISFDAMEQEEFERFYSAAIDAVLQHILPTMDTATANRLMNMIVEGWG